MRDVIPELLEAALHDGAPDWIKEARWGEGTLEGGGVRITAPKVETVGGHPLDWLKERHRVETSEGVFVVCWDDYGREDVGYARTES